jgi:hypothetical protein
MEGAITDGAREAMLRSTLSRVGRAELKTALARAVDPRVPTSPAVRNAVNALRRHADPVAALDKVQYRAVLPYAAAAYSDACLAATIESLGDHADDPTREQLLEALDAVRSDHDDVTIAVMLASVADGGMPASDLCFDVLATDPRYGVTDWADREVATPAASVVPGQLPAENPDRREARRSKKQRDAEQRRRTAGATRKAEERLRQARKDRRIAAAVPPPDSRSGPTTGHRTPGVVSSHIRRATLTPAEAREFDPDDPWVSGVVYAWVPFDSVDPVNPDLDGKERPCVVVAGSATHLLVRAGYSESGVKSRDWKSVPVGHWRRAGFAQPTWVDVETVRVERPEAGPLGWLATEDWNALW